MDPPAHRITVRRLAHIIEAASEFRCRSRRIGRSQPPLCHHLSLYERRSRRVLIVLPVRDTYSRRPTTAVFSREKRTSPLNATCKPSFVNFLGDVVGVCPSSNTVPQSKRPQTSPHQNVPKRPRTKTSPNVPVSKRPQTSPGQRNDSFTYEKVSLTGSPIKTCHDR